MIEVIRMKLGYTRVYIYVWITKSFFLWTKSRMWIEWTVEMKF
jgi:hypothetical protein